MVFLTRTVDQQLPTQAAVVVVGLTQAQAAQAAAVKVKALLVVLRLQEL
jgi:hypothetical protein